MKKPQRDPVYKIDEIEDLTLFANESFDTQDLDLFEFSSEESSPLMRLKSIILSLDWEINDEILQELADELENLQSLWQDDKVAEVYLQGLNKIGGYIRSKGAYAHPNSIKLLLTFFSNFERIISSENITGGEITQLLNADVRKFRILQFQINQSEAEATANADDQLADTALSSGQQQISMEENDAKQLKAAILSLDWEVTNESLKQFNTNLSPFHQKYSKNKPALVLVQGLQALGDYISEMRANAHSEAFILLHSFNDALEQITTTEQPLDQEKIQELLADRINHLNNLKMLIAAQTAPPLDEQHINGVVDEISTPDAMDTILNRPAETTVEEPLPTPTPAFLHADSTEQPEKFTSSKEISTDSLAAEIDTLFGMDMKPAMETADVQYPDEMLPLDAIHPVDDELADDFIEAQFETNHGFMPALSGTDEVSGYNEDAEPFDLPTQSDLADQLDFLFSESGDEYIEPSVTLSALDSTALESAIDEEMEPVAALADVNPEQEPSERLTLDDMEESIVSPALSKEDAQFEQNALDIQSKLDNFFAEAITQPENAETPAQSPAEENEQSLFFNEESGIESALADSDEERGFSEKDAIAAFDYTPMEEIEEKLDFFFGKEPEEEEPISLAETPNEPAPEISWGEEKQSGTLERQQETRSPIFDFDKMEEQATIAPALDDFIEPEFAEETEETSLVNEEVPDRELEGALDFFFDACEDDEQETTAETTVDELTQSLEASIDAGQENATANIRQELTTLRPEEIRQIQLDTLGAHLPAAVRTLSHKKISECTQLIASLQKSELPFPAGPKALLQLLYSVISLLIRLPKKDDAATEKLVNYLFRHIPEEQYRPEVLPEAINRFSHWLQDASTLMPLVPTETNLESGPRFEYTAKELYFELSELHAHIKDEFAQLRHEMHHR